MKKSSCILDLSIFLIAYGFIIYSLESSIQIRVYELFSRSGAILIIASGFIEIKYIYLQLNRITEYTKQEMGFSLKGVFNMLKVSKSDKVMRVISYSSLILGTLIWAYGDLFLKRILNAT